MLAAPGPVREKEGNYGSYALEIRVTKSTLFKLHSPLFQATRDIHTERLHLESVNKVRMSTCT